MTETIPQPETYTPPHCEIWSRERVISEKHDAQSQVYISLLMLESRMILTQPRPELN